jgi:hypothetical protein
MSLSIVKEDVESVREEYKLSGNELLIILKNEMNYSLMELMFKFGITWLYEYIYSSVQIDIFRFKQKSIYAQ